MRTKETSDQQKKKVVVQSQVKRTPHVLDTADDYITVGAYANKWDVAVSRKLVSCSYVSFLKALVSVSARLKILPCWLLRLFYFETGPRRRLSCTALNQVTKARGLFQLLPKYRSLVNQQNVKEEKWGWSNEAENALDFLTYVKTKFEERGDALPSAPFESFVELYLINFWPAAYFTPMKRNTPFKSSKVTAATIAARNPKFDNGLGEVTINSVEDALEVNVPLFANFTDHKIKLYLKQFDADYADPAAVEKLANTIKRNGTIETQVDDTLDAVNRGLAVSLNTLKFKKPTTNNSW